MKYEPYFVQDYFHKKLGSPLPDQYKSKKSAFISLELTRPDVANLKSCAEKDSIFYYQKGIQSLCEGILDLSRHCFSWATVKLYYSVFYFLRATAIHYNYLLVRWVGLFYIKLVEGGKPSTHLLSEIRNDHSFACNFYIKLITSNDVFNTNTIDSKPTYLWLMEQREYANYRMRYFDDPTPWEDWAKFGGITQTKLKDDIQIFIDDAIDKKFLYCFQPEFACLSLPISRAIETKRLLDECITCRHEILSSRKEFVSRADTSKILEILLGHLIS